jgi:hypothetical protein
VWLWLGVCPGLALVRPGIVTLVSQGVERARLCASSIAYLVYYPNPLWSLVRPFFGVWPQVPLVVSRAKGLPVFLLSMTPTEVPSPRAQIIAPDPGEPSIVVSTITSAFYGEVNKEVSVECEWRAVVGGRVTRSDY